ncbi:MAG: hypothetical protein EOL97_10035 [Spirochaetia bacterium]|nr:hypothetical protein [Spirochaetia bacterium]
MEKLKILADQLAKFVELASSKGKIESALYKINVDRIMARTSSGDGLNNVTYVSDIELDGSQYTFNGEEMLLPIKNNKMFMDILLDFGKQEVNISIVENYLVIETQNSKVELSLSAPEYIKSNVEKKPNLKYDSMVSIHSNIMKKVFKNMKRLDSTYIFLKVENGILSIITGDENLDKITEKIEVDLPDLNVKFGKLLQYAIDVLDGDLSVGIGNDYPMTINMESEGILATFYIIPCD